MFRRFSEDTQILGPVKRDSWGSDHLAGRGVTRVCLGVLLFRIGLRVTCCQTLTMDPSPGPEAMSEGRQEP